MTWLVGALVIVLGLSQRGLGSSSWTAVWITAAVLWFFLGVGLVVLVVSKVVTGKIGAGLNAAPRQPRPGAPAPKGEHDE